MHALREGLEPAVTLLAGGRALRAVPWMEGRDPGR